MKDPKDIYKHNKKFSTKCGVKVNKIMRTIYIYTHTATTTTTTTKKNSKINGDICLQLSLSRSAPKHTYPRFFSSCVYNLI